MIRFFRRVILFVFAAFLIALMVANRHTVPMGLDPFAAEAPSITIDAPMFVYLFAALLAGAVLGGLGAWIGQGRWRELARRRTKETYRLRGERERLAREMHTVQSPDSDATRLPAR